jgi:uncharacterized membrane protein YfcA
MSPVLLMQIIMVIYGAIFGTVLFRDVKKHKDTISDKSSWALAGSSGIPLFFDALGIGSFAPQTAIYKFSKLIPDKLIPGSLNVMCVLPCVISTLLYVSIIEVDAVTLFSIVISASIGGALGGRYVSKLPEKKIQLGMGFALIVVAIFMFLGQVNLMPSGGEATGLTGWRLILANIICFFIGAFMAIGIGNYAPMMALTYALGMSPRCAFPIMMAAGAFIMASAGFSYIQSGMYDRKAAVIGSFAGIIGISIAVFIVKSLPLYILKWVVIVAILYASFSMFQSALKGKTIETETAVNENI